LVAPAHNAAEPARQGKPAMSTRQDPLWTVTCQPGAAVPAVAQALRAAGLEVTDTLEMIGVINGHAPATLKPALEAVPGVADVAPLLGFQLDPGEG
jgi:rhodanese-related sulfurtransferase